MEPSAMEPMGSESSVCRLGSSRPWLCLAGNSRLGVSLIAGVAFLLAAVLASFGLCGKAEARARPPDVLVKYAGGAIPEGTPESGRKSANAVGTMEEKAGTATPTDDIRAMISEPTATVQRSLARLGISGRWLSPGESLDEVLADLRQDPSVEYAEPNRVYHALELIPNDPGFADQWALRSMNLPAAWSVNTGTDATITAVLDTGVDAGHKELSGRVLAGYDFVNMDPSPADDDPERHGTAVGGVIACVTNNSYGLAGTTWRGKILPLKVLDALGDGYSSDIALAVQFAVDNGARVINLSLGGDEDSMALRDAVDYALRRGVVVVAAAGNGGTGRVCYPAAIPGVLAVGAVSPEGLRSSFSNYGADLDLVAPGEGVLVLQRSGWTYRSGTSFATPHVAGLVGLMLSVDPLLSPQEVEHLLSLSSVDVGASGKDEYYGYGRVDARRALEAVLGDFTFDGAVDLYDLVRCARNIESGGFSWSDVKRMSKNYGLTSITR